MADTNDLSGNGIGAAGHAVAEPGIPGPCATITVIGEALIDLVPDGAAGVFRAQPGGSPFNVAVGLSRLGHRTALMARLADDGLGRILRRHAAQEGVDLTAAPHAGEPTTLAVVSVDDQARAEYEFYHQGTADWQWTAAEVERIPGDTAVLHLGSLASWTPPGDEHLRAAAHRMRAADRTLISYDPNIRASLIGEPAHAVALIEQFVAAAHLVKASREDITWLYPDSRAEEVAARWLELGAVLAVITDGPNGACAWHARTGPTHRPGRPTTVVDTIGAGDAFTAGLLGALVRRGLHGPEALAKTDPDALAAVLDEAILVSSLTCERIGADPPVAIPRGQLPADSPLTAADLRFKDPA